MQRISHFRVLMSFTDGSLEDEQLVLDEFSDVVTNSSGGDEWENVLFLFSFFGIVLSSFNSGKSLCCPGL